MLKYRNFIDLSKIRWDGLSLNPNAIHILEVNQDKIDWENLSGNPNAIHILEANQDKINWKYLSSNPNAIHLLKANIDKINWYFLSGNPSIFEYDYDALKEKCSVYKEELIQKAFHPTRIIKYLSEDYDVETMMDFL
jgi:hypothetical protein